MPTFVFTSPEGKKYTVVGPDGATRDEAFQNLQSRLNPNPALADRLATDTQQKSAFDTTASNVENIVPGAIRGAASIGSTLLAPIDMAKDAINGKGLSLQSNRDRRAGVDAGLATLGADPNSIGYKFGKLGGEVAGTAGVGPALATGLRIIAPAAGPLAAAVESGGLAAQNAGIGTRIAGGAINGGASAGLVNPPDAAAGAVIGGGLPVAAKLGGMAGNALDDARQAAANKLMQSALKPTIAQLKSGDAQTAVKTLLSNGVNPTKGGVEKLRSMIDDLNTQISDKIQNSGATISKQKVLNALAPVEDQFVNQVSPLSDLGSIDDVRQGFLSHPLYPNDQIPVQDAQALKQGTYKVLSKKYGQLGSADTEAQKGLARGLKDEIAAAVPDVGALNAKESDLIKTLNVTERRALMDMNKNPMGLAALASNPMSWAAFMADKSALFKSLAARTLNSVQPSYLSRLSLGAPITQKTLGNGLTLGGAEAIQGSQQ